MLNKILPPVIASTLGLGIAVTVFTLFSLEVPTYVAVGAWLTAILTNLWIFKGE